MSPGQIMPGQMSLWQLESVLDVPRNLPVKFHQNWVSNSWNIPDMDKCHLDKCCLDKCHRYSWKLFLDVPRSLYLNFHQNWVSNSWDITVFTTFSVGWLGGWVGGWVVGELESNTNLSFQLCYSWSCSWDWQYFSVKDNKGLLKFECS